MNLRGLLQLLAPALFALAWGVGQGAREAVAFGVALLVLPLAAVVWVAVLQRNITAQRRCPERAFEEDAVSVRFRVENRSWLPAPCVRIEDHFGPDKLPRKQTVAWPGVSPRGGVAASYMGRCLSRRGSHRLGPAQLLLSDPLGLVSCRRVLAEGDAMLIYPGLTPLPGLPGDEPSVLHEPGPREALPGGASLDILGVREWRPGDPLRHIHWASTARRGAPVIILRDPRAAADVTLVLDLHGRSLRGMGRGSTLEHALRVAASTAAWVCRRGGRVAVVGQGREPLHVPPGHGEGHLHEMLEALAFVRPDGEELLEQMLERWVTQLPTPSTVVVILGTQAASRSAMRELLGAMATRGLEVIVVLLDESTFIPLWREQLAMDEVADVAVVEGLLTMEQVRVICLASGEAIDAAFARAILAEKTAAELVMRDWAGGLGSSRV